MNRSEPQYPTHLLYDLLGVQLARTFETWNQKTSLRNPNRDQCNEGYEGSYGPNIDRLHYGSTSMNHSALESSADSIQWYARRVIVLPAS